MFFLGNERMFFLKCLHVIQGSCENFIAWPRYSHGMWPNEHRFFCHLHTSSISVAMLGSYWSKTIIKRLYVVIIWTFQSTLLYTRCDMKVQTESFVFFLFKFKWTRVQVSILYKMINTRVSQKFCNILVTLRHKSIVPDALAKFVKVMNYSGLCNAQFTSYSLGLPIPISHK